jgi:hypothetical protein
MADGVNQIEAQRQPYVDVPIDLPNPQDRELKGGRIVIPGYSPKNAGNSPFVFWDRLVFFLVVHDGSNGDHTPNGQGIKQVDINIVRNEDDQIVHSVTEYTPHYCFNGGDNLDCNGQEWIFSQHNNKWPSGEEAMANGNDYTVYFSIYKTSQGQHDEDSDPEVWIWNFRLAPAPEDLMARIVETERSTTSSIVHNALVFQVEAYDIEYGNHDGAGIDHVAFFIYDSRGQLIYNKDEDTASYCAFGGTAPCPAKVLPADGYYTFRAVVYAQNGQSKIIETGIQFLRGS